MDKIIPEERHESVKEKIEELLSHYEEGMDIFKNATSWEHPVTIKESSKDVPDLPQSWLYLVERVQSIIAQEKYDLDYYKNEIWIIRDDQMLDAYSSVGMPVNYEHWSFGQQRLAEEKALEKGQMGLAYEIVINTDPAIAYCMEKNSPLMQMLVIAHASFGHNSFFKGNHMFKTHTNASTIIHDLQYMRDYIFECEEKYGYLEVERLLDSCHALESHGVDRYIKPKQKDKKKLKEREDALIEKRFTTPHIDPILGERKTSLDAFDNAANDNSHKNNNTIRREENLLKFIADNAPHLPEWKREIIRMVANKAQYFYPQKQTQVMNEGWASFWHYQIIHDMDEMGLLSDKQMGEFYASHTSVLFQPDHDSPYFSGRMNPYTLGFAIFHDIKRICMNPTEEDYKFSPDIAGNGDWLGTLKDAMLNYRDESFVLQYLSPAVIRELSLFAYTDDENEHDYIIAGAQDSREGFDKVREVLASNYRLADIEPIIEAVEYHHRTDRRLVLEHTVYNDKPLDDKNTNEIMKHLYRLWKHPVILRSVTQDGEFYGFFDCPPDTVKSDRDPGLKLG